MSLGGTMEQEVMVSKEVVQEQDTPVIVAAMSDEELGRGTEAIVDEIVTEPVKEEPVKEEIKETVKEVITEPVKATQEEPKTENPYDNLLKELEATKQRLTDKDKFIQRQGNEIGELRKFAPPEEVARIKEQVKTEYDRIHYEQGPFAADEYKKQVERNLQEEFQRREVLQDIEKTQITRQRIVTDVPTFESTIEDMADSLRNDGVSEDRIAIFKTNPYLLNYGELRNIHNAAVARKQFTIKNQEVESLKAKIAELEKKPGDYIRRIDQATKTINGSSSGTDGKRDSNVVSINKPLAQMSDKELQEIKAQTG
jgi:hypothetical protein